MTRVARTAILGALVLALTGCAAAPTSGPAAPRDEIVVFAAASLTDSFAEIADAFTAEHPGITVTFNFGGSSALAGGIVAGAPADVFAAASPETMRTVTDEGLAGTEPIVFARNSLTIAVPAGNPAGITGIRDFADPARTIALCAPEVPCGAAATALFENAGITAAPDTLEEDVRAALTKVELGEVDAAMVYRTDIRASDGLVEEIDVAEAPSTDYLIAALADASRPQPADAFVEFVLGDEAQTILNGAGFDTD